jgi:pantoate--beta-alanine ligase
MLVLPVLTTPQETRAFLKQFQGQSIALVPTMGNLHVGHCQLIQYAKQHADVVVVSIFVNPTQFAPNEDFNQYPRTWEADVLACQQAGATAVLAPQLEALYPMGTTCTERFSVHPPQWLTQQLCGLDRPTHFEGVATVVLKLLNWVQPTIAIFGEKDAQQLAVLRWMVQDLGLPVTMMGYPIVRQPDGLACSSRNQYLVTVPEKQVALALYGLLSHVQTVVQQALAQNPAVCLSVEQTYQQAWEALASQYPQEPSLVWQYRQAVDATTFKPQQVFSVNSLLLVAARVGNKVRLIDNLKVYPSTVN